ncbi:hypothetical protein BG53_07280 [Paenibacillus darwinianus]|uniref:Uncharacterized protein n=1 Tax=Paenibacillus darwinianus TaxID=1380763 RepID=A0A9W5RYV1_9BACL|nr:hypothetical protein [Paenibacillus darwinianus]EXX85793.1 hypothetical protein CH50_08755 [Paenibacillus darwinianus]EXX85964.1 hypothetical protein BG53_07280 [Paenibacillus darwinianus]EXX88672.1 hypothetical protein BG52_01515 [Paenibacillus darwinianus]
MIISIAVVKINCISHVGSINIGKTILSRNTSVIRSYPEPPEVQQLVSAEGNIEVGQNVC